MALEATMICIDNSEWMRNSDHLSPNGLHAQAEAVHLIYGSITQSNPENIVGVVTMAGKGVRILATPTRDLRKIQNCISCIHGLEIGGEVNLVGAIEAAQLVLKHRPDKNQHQRIIVFAGSPVKYDKKVLESIGEKLKETGVALDIVNFGEEDNEKAEKLEALLAAVNNNDIVRVAPGSNALADVILRSPIITRNGEGGSSFVAATASAALGLDFGVDPNLDPELALALRLSMEEERARRESASKRAAEEARRRANGGEQQALNSQDATVGITAPAALGLGFGVDPNLDPELALALRLSMEEEKARQEAADEN